MGIQINGQTDTITAVDGALTVSGAELPTVTNLNATGIVTASGFVGNITGNINSTGINTVGSGSASAPSISPTGDSNTGIFFPAADTIAFAEGGVESGRFDSSGRLGIGTANPSTKIHILGTGNGSTGSTGLSDSSVASALLLKPTSGSGTALALGARNTGGHYIQGLYDASSVDSVRDVQINPYGGSVGIGTFADAFGGSPGSSTFVVATTGVERLRIDSSGRVRMPYQPAFHVPKTTGDTLGTSASKLTFGTATYDVGSNYSDANDRFTAPVAGKYFFYCSINVLNSGNFSYIQIRKNGNLYGQIFFAAGNYPRMDFNPSGIIDLAVSDYVEVWGLVNTGTITVDNAGYFGGYLLG